MTRVFLDHQSATPLLPEIFEEMKPYFMEAYGNPSSLHHYGLRVREAMKLARARVAALINAESEEEMFFTTEGCSMAEITRCLPRRSLA